MIILEMTDHRLDTGAAFELAFDLFDDTALLARSVDAEPVPDLVIELDGRCGTRRSFSLLMGRGCVCVFCGSRAVRGASGEPRHYAATIRSSVTSRRML